MKICGEEGDGRVKKFFAVYLVKNARKSDFWGDWWYDGIVRMADLSWINRNMGCIEIRSCHIHSAALHRLIETWDVLKSSTKTKHPASVLD